MPTAHTGWGQLEKVKDLDSGGLVSLVFYDQLMRQGMRSVVSARWPVDAETLDPLVDVGEISLHERYAWGEHVLARGDRWIATVTREHGEIIVRAAGPDAPTTQAALAAVRERFPRSEPSDIAVPIHFWSYSPRGPQLSTRRVSVACWEEIAGNYAEATRDQLERLVDGFRPAFGGQLILWQGLPGTGKTWALRALAWAWREWAEFHYIVDPEQLFGEHGDYLIEVLLSDPGVEVGYGEPAAPREPPWRVLILEDTGELLAADAKERTGQALSRLLNVVDGLIGQGLRVLVLVTTNEELKRLHPAVSRPGRCAAQVSFEPLAGQEALRWLADRGADRDVRGPRSLAELYAIADGYAVEDDRPLVGFAR